MALDKQKTEVSQQQTSDQSTENEVIHCNMPYELSQERRLQSRRRSKLRQNCRRGSQQQMKGRQISDRSAFKSTREGWMSRCRADVCRSSLHPKPTHHVIQISLSRRKQLGSEHFAVVSAQRIDHHQGVPSLPDVVH